MRTPDQSMDWEMDPPSDRGMGSGLGRGSYREMEPESPQPAESQDLTLGMTALLGIFLAVVLVCAVFFGFGYSTGRTLHGAKAAPSPSATVSGSPAAKADGTMATEPDASGSSMQENAATAPALTAAPPLAKPSAGAALSTESRVAQDAAAIQRSDGSTSYPATLDRPSPPVTRPAPGVNANSVPETAAAATSGVMVQIAAVAHPGDADMLARALRSNGYAATVRTEPQDKFLHVQVGPFATRDEAKAMRARLQGDGYNAFLKP